MSDYGLEKGKSLSPLTSNNSGRKKLVSSRDGYESTNLRMTHLLKMFIVWLPQAQVFHSWYLKADKSSPT